MSKDKNKQSVSNQDREAASSKMPDGQTIESVESSTNSQGEAEVRVKVKRWF